MWFPLHTWLLLGCKSNPRSGGSASLCTYHRHLPYDKYILWYAPVPTANTTSIVPFAKPDQKCKSSKGEADLALNPIINTLISKENLIRLVSLPYPQSPPIKINTTLTKRFTAMATGLKKWDPYKKLINYINPCLTKLNQNEKNPFFINQFNSLAGFV